MRKTSLRNLLLTMLVCLPGIGWADDPPVADNNQVVVPEVDRRDVQVPHYPSNDFDVGLFAGTYNTQNFGTNFEGGLRLGYSITEDFFVQSAIAKTKVSDAAFRQILPGGIFPNESEELRYYNLSVGYNALKGETFIGSTRAMPITFYFIGGVGTTVLDDEKYSTWNIGTGMRLFINDTFSVTFDGRDNFFTYDLLGERQHKQNLEMTVGFLVSF